jgi:hypothetical protein
MLTISNSYVQKSRFTEPMKKQRLDIRSPFRDHDCQSNVSRFLLTTSRQLSTGYMLVDGLGNECSAGVSKRKKSCCVQEVSREVFDELSGAQQVLH